MLANAIILTAMLFLSPRNHVQFTLGAILSEDSATITEWVDDKADEFLTQCTKFRSMDLCQRAAHRTIVHIVNDYTFYCAVSFTGLCAGLFSAPQAWVIIYNKYNSPDIEGCDGGWKVRTRYQMYVKSGYHTYWLHSSAKRFCGEVDVMLPSFIHELCHNFGVEIGHMPGKEECEP